jgi:hypothetical protein
MDLKPATTFVNYVYKFEISHNDMKVALCRYNRGL